MRKMGFDWNSTRVIDADFENSDTAVPTLRMLWVVSNCLTCGGQIMHGASFTDCRVTGESLLDNAIKKAVLWIIGNCEATGCKISSATKRTEFEDILKEIWQQYQ